MKYTILVALLIWICSYSSCYAVTQNQRNSILEAHNSIRLEYGLPVLIWDAKLEKKAQEWANAIAKNGTFSHSSSSFRGGVWENLYMYSLFGQKVISSGSDATYSWIDEGWNYNYSSNSCTWWAVCWHFTQIIWKTTKRIGCGQSTRKIWKTTNIYWICHYDPAGNIVWEKPY